jgi:ABC-type branched-subunit amino acid transport system ATPase component
VDQNLAYLRDFVSRLYILRNGRIAAEMRADELTDARRAIDAYLGEERAST